MANQPNRPSAGRRRISASAVQPIGWLLLGLLIGLLIGWVAWPVEWLDAELDDLHPDISAQFVSATADAYVASGGQDPSTALARMQSFADPQAAVFDAITFYQRSNDPNRAIREVNLRSLASALNARSLATTTAVTQADPARRPEIGWLNWTLGALAALLLLAGGVWIGRRLWTRQAGAQQTETHQGPVHTNPLPIDPAAGPAQPVAPANTGPRPGAQPSGLANEPFDAQLDQRQPSARLVVETWDNPADAPAFNEPISPPASPTDPQVQMRSTESEETTDTIERIFPSTGGRTAQLPATDYEDDEIATAFTIRPVDGDSFAEPGDREDFDDENRRVDSGEDSWAMWRADQPSGAEARPAIETDEDGSSWINDVEREKRAEGTSEGEEIDKEFDTSFDEEFDNGFDNEIDPEFDHKFDDEFDIEPAQEPNDRSADAEGVSKENRVVLPQPVPDDRRSEDEEETGIVHRVQDVLNSWRGEKEESTAPRSSNEIGTFTAEFSAAILAYEQSFTITSTGTEDGTPLGACGMAISESLDKSAASSNNVHLLDVWLYDGIDVRSYSQYLVSPGVDKECLGDEAKSAATITGELLELTPGLTFRIASKNLILDCRIVTADLLRADVRPSPLRSVRLEMTAKATK